MNYNSKNLEFLTSEEVAAFERDGFLVIHNFLDENVVNDVMSRAVKLVKEAGIPYMTISTSM